jgi:Mrp family chromosome partitioning ATPase
MLHQVYQVPIGPGLGELLSAREQGEFGEYLQETMTENLWLIPAGAKRHGALAELSDERVAELFQEFKEHFEFIIVDGPPVLPVVDTRLVARHADGVVMSMLRDVSELPKVKSACQLLQSYRVQILGGVVIGASGDVYYGYPPERYSSIA